MLQLRFLGSLAGLFLSSSALASPPNVAVDISPVHSLVTQVMYGVATPELLIQPEASPHSYSLRPSEAQALSDADIVFWMSQGLTPWLEKSLDTLSSKAHKVEMISVEGTTAYAFREGVTFEGHDDHDEHEEEQHSDDHAKHEEEHQDHEPGWFGQLLSLFSSDDHALEHEEETHHDDQHDEHNHEGEDPHAWLDPMNAKVWVIKIRDVLAKHDPENASTYQQNAEKALARLDQQIDKISQETQKMNQLQFIVFHDAYQYFERRFGVLAAGSISLGDAQDPSPARVAEIRDVVKKLNITCVFSEPQYNAGLVNSVFEGTSVKTLGVMDPLGANIKVGKDQYEQLLNHMLSSLKQCES
jgi:zinc transport system substrate-binding protein